MLKRSVFLLLGLSFGLSLCAQITNVRKWRKSQVDSLDFAMFLYDEKMYEEACPLFEGILKNHPKEEFIKYSFAKCALYRSDKHEEAYLILTELYPKYNDIPEMRYDIALGALYNLRFDEADQYVDKFLSSKRLSLQDKRKADALKKNIAYARYYTANPTDAQISNLGQAINSGGNEYVPAITADDSLLIFTYSGERSIGGRQNENLLPDPKGFYMEDLYFSEKHKGQFQTAKPIDSLNTNLPDAAISLSQDGRMLFLYQDLDDGHGDIYFSEFDGEKFAKPKKMKGLNSYSWDGHCSLAPDGRTLYFSSERVGGFGGRDLYRAELQADSTWGNISNLGDSINTRFDEDAPFMHADGQTLFFSSKGRTSMGGYDIFRVRLNPADSTFGYAENLGWPINSTDDDIYFVLAADGKTGYYSSGRKGGQGLKDLYQVEPRFSNPTGGLVLVKGVVSDSMGPVVAQINIRNLSNGTEFGSSASTKGNGKFLVSLPAGFRYNLSFIQGNRQKDLLVDASNAMAFEENLTNVDMRSAVRLAPIVASASAATRPTEPIASNTGNTATKSPDLSAAGSQTLSSASSKTPVAVGTSSVAANTAVPVKAAAPAAAAPAVATGAVAAKGASSAARKESFVPNTKYQEKSLRYAQKYGNISAPGLEFRVQFAALKSGKNYTYPELYKLGKVERLPSTDNYTRLTIGGSFKTLDAALEMNQKVVKAGHPEAFVIVFYKGKRSSFEALEKEKIFTDPKP